MISFWKWVKEYAAKKERKYWIKTNHNDQKCPHCNTWQGNCGGWADIKPYDLDECHDKLKCGQCGQWSTWFCGAPVMILVDPKKCDNKTL